MVQHLEVGLLRAKHGQEGNATSDAVGIEAKVR